MFSRANSITRQADLFHRFTSRSKGPFSYEASNWVSRSKSHRMGANKNLEFAYRASPKSPIRTERRWLQEPVQLLRAVGQRP